MPQAIPAAPEKPIREFPTPNPNNWFVSLLVARESKLYQQNAPVPRGTLYATLPGADVKVVAEYPNLYFLAEVAPLGYRDPSTMPVDGFVIWYFSTEQLAEDTYNAEVSYLAENINFPGYARSYMVRRDVYEAGSFTPAYATALTGLIGIKVTAGGSGYNSTDTVNIAGGGGATAQLVVNATGTILSVVVTAEGSGYDSASLPAITVTSGGGGATLTAIVQPKTAVLVSQKKLEYPEDSPLRSEFVRVLRVYETLPGPWLYSSRIDEDGAVVTMQTRRNLRANITEGEVLAGGVLTKTTAKDDSSIVTDEIVESRAIPGADIPAKTYADRGYLANVARTLLQPNTVPPTESHLIHVERQMLEKNVSRQDVLTFADGRPLLTKEFNEYGGLDVATDSYVAPSTVPSNSGATIQRLVQEREKEARLISLVVATGSVITDIEKVDGQVPGSRATDEYYLVLASTSIPSDAATIEYSRFRFPKNPGLRIERKRTYTIPPDLEETDNLGYHFPTLFTSFYSDNLQGTTLFQRGGFSEIVPHRIVHHFGTTKLTPAVYNIVEDELLVFSIQVSGLTDGVVFSRTNQGVTYTQIRAATSPSASTYIGLEGSEVIARGESKIWHAGIFRTITAYVTLQ